MNPEPAEIPQRLAAKRALQEQLQGITKAEGYNFDIGIDRVFRNRALLGDQVLTDLRPPLLSVIEAPRADFQVYAGDWDDRRTDMMTVLVQGIVADDKTPDSEDDADFLCHDVQRRLARCLATTGRGKPMFPGEHMLGGKIVEMQIAAPVIRPPELGVSAYHFFYLPVRLKFAGVIGE